MKQKQPPKAVAEWMSDGDHTEAEAKHYIRTNIEFFETSISDKAGQGTNNWIALKFSCTPAQAARAIEWAKKGGRG